MGATRSFQLNRDSLAFQQRLLYVALSRDGMWSFGAAGGTPIYSEPEVIVATLSWPWIGRVLSRLGEVGCRLWDGFSLV